MIGPVGTAENERLTTRLGRERFLRKQPAGFGENTTVSERIALAAAADAKLATATGTMSGTDPRITAMAAERARAALASIGRRATAMTLLLSVPEEMPEADVRSYLRPAYEAAAYEDVSIVRENRAEVLAHVSAVGVPAEMLVTANRAEAVNSEATAKTAAAEAEETMDAEPAWSVVMAGVTGLEGTLLLLEENRAAMEARYPKHFLQREEELPGEAATAELILTGLANGAKAAVPGGDGGVYGALWKLGEKLRVGMEIELPEIPIAQITIEVCEVTDRDPYQIPAGGCVLFVTAEPERLAEALTTASPQTETAVIGQLTREAARVLRNRGETRYLEPYRGGA